MKKSTIILGITCSLISTSLFARGSSRPANNATNARRTTRPFVNRYYSNCVNNVEYKFKRMSKRYRNAGWFNVRQRNFHRYGYRLHLFNRNPIGLENHLQGMVKLSGRGNFLITGADYKRKEAHIFSVIRNVVVRKTVINRGKFWHSGGIQAAGNVLAVPIEPYKTGGNESLIQFFNISNPANPIKLRVQISNPRALAPALGFYRRREDLRYVLLAWNQLYISKTSNILHGFGAPQTISGAPWGQGQTLVRDCRTKQFYLMTFMNTDSLSPIRKGQDRIQFLKLNFRINDRNYRPWMTGVEGTTTTYYQSKFFSCNFNAATHISAFHNRFVIYATHHYRSLSGYRINLCNFY